MNGSRITKLTMLLLIIWTVSTWAQVTPDQARRIEKAIPATARVVPEKPRKLLIWNTPFMDKSPHKGYTIPQAQMAFELLGEKTGAYEPVVSDDIAMYLPENIKQFDAILFNNANGKWIRPTPEDMKRLREYGANQDEVESLLRKSLLDFVRNGGGMFAYHHAIGGNTHWPQFLELIGAGYWGHPWNEEVGVKLEDPDHPLLRTFEGKDFRIAEEIFQFREPYSRDKVRILLSLDVKNTNMNVPWIHRTDNDFALAWVKSYGKGRVFYGAIGHRTEHWWNTRILEFYLDGLQFVMGDIDADTTPSSQISRGPEPGFESLFNGKDLSGWRGNPRIWTVCDGVINGQTTPENRIAENDFLIWTGGDVRDFELRLKFRIVNGNSGIYFRSLERRKMQNEALVGCQADFSADGRWTGVVMEYTRRGILAERGQKVEIDGQGRIKVVASVGDPDQLLAKVKNEQWNDYTLIARGGHIVLKINDTIMCDLQDNDPKRIPEGKLALQVHRGPDMQVQFKDIRMKQF